MFVNMMAIVGKRALQHMLLFGNDALIKIAYIFLLFFRFFGYIPDLPFSYHNAGYPF